MIDEETISKFKNIYIMILYSIMTNSLKKVDHFLSDEVHNFIFDIINDNINKNEIQMFDELNVSNIRVLSLDENEDKNIVTIELESNYMNYKIDSVTRKYKSGNNTHRENKKHILVFEKMKNSKNKNMIFRCSNCGNNIDVNFYGTCPYCRKTVNLEEYDYILTKIDNI